VNKKAEKKMADETYGKCALPCYSFERFNFGALIL
jgi:hypothetical protein